MKHIYLSAIYCLFTTAFQAQTVVFEDNFDTYTTGQGVAAQSPVWESFSGANGGSDDAIASTEHFHSGPNAMKVVNYKDIVYPFHDISTGAYIIEFNIFLHDEGYFNLQHEREQNWALDIYLTSGHQILYLDEDGAANSEVIGTYSNDEWMHFQFVVDLDIDTVLTYKDGVLLHSDTFSNSQDGAPSNHLDIVNFYGLAGFNGVENSHYFVDDFKVTEITGLTAVQEAGQQNGITIFPNPAKNVLALNADEELKGISVKDLSGQLILEQQLSGQHAQLSLTELPAGVYLVEVISAKGSNIGRLVIE